MKIVLSEKQLEKLIKSSVNQEVSEQDDPAAAEPSAGTSATQSGGEGYPEVTTWSGIVGSKLARGVANPLGIGKREDKVNRDGPANQLK